MRIRVQAKVAVGVTIGLLMLIGVCVWYAYQPVATDDSRGLATTRPQQYRADDNIFAESPKEDTPVATNVKTLNPLDKDGTIAVAKPTEQPDNSPEGPLEEIASVPELLAETHEPRCMGMTRAEMEVEVGELEQEVRTQLTRTVSLYNEVVELCESAEFANPEVQSWVKQAEQEYRRIWQELTYPSAEDMRNNRPAPLHRYASYTVALGGSNPTSPGGWLHDMMKLLPFRTEAQVLDVIWK